MDKNLDIRTHNPDWSVKRSAINVWIDHQSKAPSDDTVIALYPTNLKTGRLFTESQTLACN